MSPVEYCIMSQVPPPYRVLAINANDIVWNALVSFFAHRRRRADAERRLLDAHRSASTRHATVATATATRDRNGDCSNSSSSSWQQASVKGGPGAGAGAGSDDGGGVTKAA